MNNLIYKINRLGSPDSATIPGMQESGFVSNRHLMVEKWSTPILVLVDLIGWCLSFLGSYLLFHQNVLHLSFLWIGPVFGTVALYLIGSYDRRSDFLSLEYFSEHLIGLALAALFSMFFAYVFSTYYFVVKPSRLFLPMLFALFYFYSIGLRRLLGLHILRQHVNGAFLVLGSAEGTSEFHRLYKETGLGRRLDFAIYETENTDGTPATHDQPESAIVSKLTNREAWYSAIILACDSARLSPQILQLLIQLHCSGMPVLTLEAFRELHLHRVSASFVGPEWLFDTEFRLSNGSFYYHVKRLMDICISAMGLLVLLPFLFLISLLIRLESRGAAIFKQRRAGIQGRVFTMYKFRTMRENTASHPTMHGDDRITRIGHLLRLTRLDELPQLWNVLIGDMSLIGPRAEWVICTEIYEKEIPHYHIRHLIKPGITAGRR